MAPENPAPAPSQPHATGSCLCKSIQYTLTAPPIHSAICHCLNCRKTSGTAFATNCLYPRASVHVHVAAPPTTTTTTATTDNKNGNLRTFKDTDTITGATFSRQFCGNCGSSLFAESDRSPDVVLVTTGSLDDGEGGFADEVLRPRVEFFCKDRRGWMEGREEGVDRRDRL